MHRILTVLLVATAAPAFADEGMWTYDAFPAAAVEKTYGFKPSSAWLDNVRLSTVRLAQGCSGSFVSKNGLVLTNHHCAHRCIEQLSTPKKDLVKAGFWATTQAQEARCPALEVNQLVTITDVTAKVKDATDGKAGQAYSDAFKSITADLEKACATAENLRCDVVTLYHGGQYKLYTYKRYQDVRLVFAPEFAIAFFGGDPDNFMFPRFDLDLAFLRIYENDQPANTPNFFPWSPDGAKASELTFVSGHPGGTSRELTMAELNYQRDVMLPRTLLRLAELRGFVGEYQRRGNEQKRHSNALLFGIENSYKALKGMYDTLLNREFYAAKAAAEAEFKAKLEKNPKQKPVLAAFDAIAKSTDALAHVRDRLVLIEERQGFSSELFGFARLLLRASVELPKPNGERLQEFAETALPATKQALFSPAPIYNEFEIARLTVSLTKLRELLGPDDPFVKKVLGRESPESLATRLVKGSKLADVKARQALWDGGQAAVAASNDPMVQLALRIDEDARAVRKHFEDDIEAVQQQNSELLAKARFELYGTSIYPDATFTLRLSYGRVAGWQEGDKTILPFTTLGGAFARHTGLDPFALPPRWLAKKGALNPETPFNFTTTNDIVGGNSGSPVINQKAELVGLIFDGNIHSLGGEYGFEAARNRAVAVHSNAIREVLQKIYGATRLVSELEGR